MISSINSQPTYNYHSCSNNSPNTSFESNLKVLLGALSTKASENYSFYNHSSNGIYALFLCRGDVDNSTCRSCVSYAGQDITTRCPSNRTAIIWFDECMLRYSDANFFGVGETSPAVLMYNVGNTTSPEEPNFGARALMNGLIEVARGTDMLYKAGTWSGDNRSEVRYGLVQCTRDINATSCTNCLEKSMTRANLCCEGKKGWRVLAPSCIIRYENYSFFRIPSPPPPPPPLLLPPQPQPQPLPDNGKTS
jgi:hypothetical protein